MNMHLLDRQEVRLKYIQGTSIIPPFLYKGNTFYNFLFIFMNDGTFEKGSTLTGKNLLLEE